MLSYCKVPLLGKGGQTYYRGESFSSLRGCDARSRACDAPAYKVRAFRVYARSFKNSDRHSKKDSKEVVLKRFVEEVEPKFMEHFVEQAPTQVVQAMRQTITNMLGTLPPNFFTITISTIGENLAQLMYSVLMTGYMLRNASYRMDLRKMLPCVTGTAEASHASNPLCLSKTVENTASTSLAFLPEDENYAPGVQKLEIEGQILRWHKQNGLERSHASQYIDMLETENLQLRERLNINTMAGPMSRGEGNELLDYIKSLEPQPLQALTSCAGQDVINASYAFVDRLMGTSDKEHLKQTNSECSTAELAQLMFWLMVVGYTLRSMEVAHDMEQALGTKLCASIDDDHPHGLLK